MRTCFIVSGVLVLSVAACGAATTAAPPQEPQGAPAAERAGGSAVVPAGGPADTEYRIQVGDQLDIKFFYNPELNEQVIVRPDGRISLQLIPEVVATDLTPAMLTKQLTQLYATDLKQPRVTVIVRGFGSQRVFVDGEVGKPGMVPILGLMTALQAIAEAGGMTRTARQSEVIIIRRGAANKPVAFTVDLKKARDGSDLSQDTALAPFDIIYVPRSRVANVNVWMDQYIRQNIPIPFSITYGLYVPR
jgi:protein involved in polysaccharide export with SLBB domain